MFPYSEFAHPNVRLTGKWVAFADKTTGTAQLGEDVATIVKLSLLLVGRGLGWQEVGSIPSISGPLGSSHRNPTQKNIWRCSVKLPKQKGQRQKKPAMPIYNLEHLILMC